MQRSGGTDCRVRFAWCFLQHYKIFRLMQAMSLLDCPMYPQGNTSFFSGSLQQQWLSRDITSSLVPRASKVSKDLVHNIASSKVWALNCLQVLCVCDFHHLRRLCDVTARLHDANGCLRSCDFAMHSAKVLSCWVEKMPYKAPDMTKNYSCS